MKALMPIIYCYTQVGFGMLISLGPNLPYLPPKCAGSGMPATKFSLKLGRHANHHNPFNKVPAAATSA